MKTLSNKVQKSKIQRLWFKYISILSIVFIFPLGIDAQSNDSIDECQFVAVYDYLCHTSDKNGLAVIDSFQIAVLVGTHTTECAEYNGVMMDYFKEWNNKTYQYGEWYARSFNVHRLYMNYPEGKFSCLDKVVPQRYLVTGNMTDIEWMTTEDTLTINGYLCNKAIGKYAGRKWTIWYAEAIPSNAGPWKLRGLPGMILLAVDNNQIHTFRFCGLLNRHVPIKYSVSKEYQPITNQKFIQYRNNVLCNKRYASNPRYYIPEGALDGAKEMWTGGSEPAAEDKLTMMSWDMFIPKTAHVYQPLELE